VEIHSPLLHEQRGWHGISGTLWEDKEPKEEQLEETMVEQDVSVAELHTQDHVAFSSVELSNKNGEIVSFLLIDGSAPSFDFKKKVIDENVRCFSIEENDENEIVKTENEKSNENSEGSNKPDVVNAVGSAAVYTVGAGVEIDDESDSEDEVYEDANYYDSEYVNTAQDLDKIVMLCQTVTVQNTSVNVCYDYGAAFSMLNEKKAEVALLKRKGQQVCSVVPGVPKEEGAEGVQTLPLAIVPLPLAGGGVGAVNVYILSETLPPMETTPLPSEVAQIFNLPPSEFAGRGGGGNRAGFRSRQSTVLPLQGGE
jgi:hypothetical protein